MQSALLLVITPRGVSFTSQLMKTYRAGWCSIVILDLYSGGGRLVSRSGHRLPRLKRIVIFLSPFSQMWGYHLFYGVASSFPILSNYLFVSNSAIRRYVVRDTDGVVV
jgi:hypothetical protein